MINRLKEFDFLRALVCGFAVFAVIWILGWMFEWLYRWFIHGRFQLDLLGYFLTLLFAAFVVIASYWYFRGGKILEGAPADTLQGFLLGVVYLLTFESMTILNNLYEYARHLIKTPFFLQQMPYTITDPIALVMLIGIPTLVGWILKYISNH